MIRALIVFVLGACLAGPCFAHKPSDSYLRLNITGNTVAGEWAIALRDLELTIGIDGNLDGKITWGELKARREAIETNISRLLTLKAENSVCPVIFNDLLVDEYSDGHYAVFLFKAVCSKPIETLNLSDQFLFDMDAQHKSLISVKAGKYAQSAILSTDLRKISLSVHAPGIGMQLREYVRQGMWHIWLGFDHFLFLIALLLPAAWVYRDGIKRIDMPFKTVFWKYSAIFLRSRLHTPLRLALQCSILFMCVRALSNR